MTAPRCDDATSDAGLVERMARGDADALGELYDRHAARMLGLVARIVGSAAEAEDLVHDVFLEAWRRAADYDPARGGVAAWLLLRARSRALDRRKSVAVSRTVPLDSERELGVEPAQDAAAVSDGERLRRTLAGLPTEQRAVLALGYFEGLSSSEIALRLGVPIGTVKSRVAAALGKLRSELGDP